MTPPHFDAEFQADLDTLLLWRRDVRQFRADALPDALVDDLLRAATRGPSVGNSQPWRFVKVASPARRRAIIDHVESQNQMAAAGYRDDVRRHYDALKLHGLADCPVVLAVFCLPDPAAGQGLGRATMNETLVYSTVCAIHGLWLKARAHGVGLGWVSIVEPGVMAGLLEVSPDWRFVALLCLGYPESEASAPLLETAGWQARLPLDEMVVQR